MEGVLTIDLLCFFGFLTSYSSSSRSWKTIDCKMLYWRLDLLKRSSENNAVHIQMFCLLTNRFAWMASGQTHLYLHGVVAGLLLWGEALILVLWVVIWGRRQVGRLKAAEWSRCLIHISMTLLNLTCCQALNIHHVQYALSCLLPEFNHFLHD